MCRNIRTLYNFDPPANEDEISAASLQYVRKISGFTKPSQANQEAFDDAVKEITEVSARLLERKLGHVRATDAHTVATANPGCHLQIQNGLAGTSLAGAEVAHPVVLLARAYAAERSSSPGS